MSAALREAKGMSSGWLQIASIVGPLVGVGVGAFLARGAQRAQYVRDRIAAETQTRRETYAAFRKALWAFASRVKVARDLAKSLQRQLEALPEGSPALTVQYDFGLSKGRQEACRDAFADLQMFASVEAQQQAFRAMESLARSHDLILQRDFDGSDGAWADYEKAHEEFSLSLNAEIREVNLALYRHVTPLWRAVLGRIRFEPLPFEVVPAPPELRPIAEGVVSAEQGEAGPGSAKPSDSRVPKLR
jgi:hypothetical protein